MQPRAFVFGNAAWDETLMVEDLPWPGASVHVRRGPSGPGGKGLNQAVVLARAGVGATLVAVIGRDAAGDRLVAALEAEGLAGGLVRRADIPTDWSGVLVSDAGENAILTTRVAAESLDPGTAVAGLSDAVPGDLCLLQGNLSAATTAAIMEAARVRGMRIAMNPSPVDLAFAPLLGRADALFMNREEARAFAGEVAPAGLMALGARFAVVTLGSEGAMLVDVDGRIARVPAAEATAVDPTGAGDVFLATALACAARSGWRIDAAALRAGAAAAALAVARAGAFAGLPSRDALAAIIEAR